MKRSNYKISIVGAGYVGMSLACLFSQYNKVVVFDINEERVNCINNKVSPIRDADITEYLNSCENVPTATTKFEDIKDSDFVIICTPTNYDENTNQFDCSSVEETIEKLKDTDATIVIKSTVPIGFTRKMREKYDTDRILFSPEFLREGKALYDNLNPSRVVVSKGKGSEEFGRVLLNCAEKRPVLIATGSDEAEAIKLFSNTYLAMRVAFFNELDSFAMKNNLNAEDIIDGVCLDKRIGIGYNNPSFGYGGYCLPKDTKQLRYQFFGVKNDDLIMAIVNSNYSRKSAIAFEIDRILNHDKTKTVGVYKLSMKTNSDNFRQSSIIDVIKILKGLNYKVVIYEPSIDEFEGFDVCNDISYFKDSCDIIITNRKSNEIEDIDYKVFTRDIFGEN